jgi:hypothetical protein
MLQEISALSPIFCSSPAVRSTAFRLAFAAVMPTLDAF